MNILAIDTATNILSLALSAHDPEPGSNPSRWYIEADAGLRHSEILMEMTALLLKQSGLKPADLNLIACMKGPGSFTGLRIGFSAAKGLALSLGIPLSPIPTLDCMAYSLSPWPGIVIPVIDAKKQRFFTALYRGGEKIADDMDAAPTVIAAAITGAIRTLDGVILTGPDAAMLHIELVKLLPATIIPGLRIDPGCRRGRAGELLELAKTRGAMDYKDAGPEYIRKSDAELK
jgi:tRNA threonylcarbamoyladenosine biosynthesis protein TsaB